MLRTKSKTKLKVIQVLALYHSQLDLFKFVEDIPPLREFFSSNYLEQLQGFKLCMEVS